MLEHTIRTYFSHSYRQEDQDNNRIFWKLFDERDFFFWVDPPSNIPIHTHLERMMNQCNCYVAVFNRRLEVPEEFCSRFVLYEFGLSLQARIPRLLIIDDRIDLKLFKRLSPDEMHYFNDSRPRDREKDLINKIDKLRKRALSFSSRSTEGRGPIGLILPDRSRDRAYGGIKVQNQIKEAAKRYGFNCREIVVPYQHNTKFALDLDSYEAVILDVRGEVVPNWIFAYTHGRLIPSIKLVHVRTREFPTTIPLPPMVNGLRMDDHEPGVESVTYWRTADDLIYQLMQAFEKLDERPTELRGSEEGVRYFDSIGRRPARVFISNSSAANPLAEHVSNALRLNNIERFHYKDEGAIPTGTLWERKLKHELEACHVFVALIGKGYKESKWCMKEWKTARARWNADQIVLLPYKVDDSDVRFARKPQVTPLSQDPKQAADKVFAEINKRLHAQDPGRNWGARQPMLLGASREVVIDTLRHLSSDAWTKLLVRLSNAGIQASPGTSRAKIRPRRLAEKLMVDVQRASVDPDIVGGTLSSLGYLIEQLEALVPTARRPILKKVNDRTQETLRARW